MITYNKYLFTDWHAGQRVDQHGDTGLGNLLYFIAGTIGIAVKNGYEYSFPRFCATDYLLNPLPLYNDSLKEEITIPWGFHGFNYPDNVIITGQLQSPKYFWHCIDLIRHYFTLKDVAEPLKDAIVMHYRNYSHPYFVNLPKKYYMTALKHFPDRRVVVITDNIQAAWDCLKEPSFEYVSNSPIVDFYLGVKAEYKVIANSSFSCWWAYLSDGEVVAPYKWYTKELDQSPKEIYCRKWIRI